MKTGISTSLPDCSRCGAEKVSFGYSYPMFPKDTIVSLCSSCYKELNDKTEDLGKQKVLLSGYIRQRKDI